MSRAAAQAPSADTRRHAVARDASHYHLVPRDVLAPADAREVAAEFAAAREAGRAVTFRSGGTSLSGQGVTDDILLDTRRHFRRIRVLDGGERVRVGPGATVRQVNAALARHGRMLGPDPASEVACTLGGVLANNSSGMTCGVDHNAYRTLESLTVVLPSGTVLDTASADADAALAAAEPRLHAGLLRLRDRVRSDDASVRTVRRLFARKNTMGYAVNAFLDFDSPVDLLSHLLIGSEGTLGFVAEATLRTLPLRPAVATGLLVFGTLAEAAAAAPVLAAAGFAAVELMDATALRVAQGLPECTPDVAALAVDGHAALLIELQEQDDAALLTAVDRSVAALAALGFPDALSREPGRRSALWHIRKGLYTSVAGARPAGTTALLEDVAVPVEHLAEACERLTALFERYGQTDAVIFGHAKDGNLHFMLTERFDGPEAVERYARITEEIVDLVLDLGGALKAEHGTGRVMAPFVERQYGPELYAVMREVKALFDPHGILNPGVVITDDARAHLHDLKATAAVSPIVDRCVECGYCEPVCPSRDLTLTPRQRIVLLREMAQAEARGDAELLARLRADYAYQGVQTCAVDGMCATTCPVGINTGDLVRGIRAEQAHGIPDAGWSAASRVWGPATQAVSGALTVAGALPAPAVGALTSAARAVLGAEQVPAYSADLPRGGRIRRPVRAPDAVAVYLPACVNTMFGSGDAGGPDVSEAFLALCERAGVRVRVPDGIGGMCCGTPWKSKGHLAGYERMSGRLREDLMAATDGGALPVVCDASSCTEGLILALGDAGIRVVDSVAFARERLLPALTVTERAGSLMLHPTCSSAQLGLDADLRALAEAVAEQVEVPLDWSCCGFAGDRGLLHPELTASATAREAAEVTSGEHDLYASLNRTCELGLTRATGRPYEHILQQLERATR
ncbi:FAD-binding and (Fe-S)-binding domain-containing protein [Leifsonia sp. NPDC080035]|uniref:D-lactate dehydrogenase (cytochrome) n=1 Tax=Leifsonia sp. NPDC080035 TaxID=3143936 RepID=A0AAU7G9S7_9MICO